MRYIPDCAPIRLTGLHTVDISDWVCVQYVCAQSGQCGIESIRNRVRAQSCLCLIATLCVRMLLCLIATMRNRVCAQLGPCAVGLCTIGSGRNLVRAQSGPYAIGSCAIESVRNWVGAQSNRCTIGSVRNRVHVRSDLCPIRKSCHVRLLCAIGTPFVH